eukprot:gene7958-9788_t
MTIWSNRKLTEILEEDSIAFNDDTDNEDDVNLILIKEIHYNLNEPDKFIILGENLTLLTDDLYRPYYDGEIIPIEYIVITNSTYAHIKVNVSNLDYSEFEIEIHNEEYDIYIIGCSETINCIGDHSFCSPEGDCVCIDGYDGEDCTLVMSSGCKDDCNGNGYCNYRLCECDKGFNGPACEIRLDSNNTVAMNMSTSKVDATMPMSSFSGFQSDKLNGQSQQTSFFIAIHQLRELDYKSNILKQFNISHSSNWTIVSTSNTVTHYQSNFQNTTVTIKVKSEMFQKATTIEWANQTVNLPDNSIKYTVRIENYPFSSSLNKLSLVWQSSSISTCGGVYNESDIKWGASSTNDMKWVVLPQNELGLYGKFTNFIKVDDKILKSPNRVEKTSDPILISSEIPYFKTYSELDPDFSVIVNINKDGGNKGGEFDECGNPIPSKKKDNNWKLPVIIVCSVVGAAIIITGIALVIKKKTGLRIKLERSFRMRSK